MWKQITFLYFFPSFQWHVIKYAFFVLEARWHDHMKKRTYTYKKRILSKHSFIYVHMVRESSTWCINGKSLSITYQTQVLDTMLLSAHPVRRTRKNMKVKTMSACITHLRIFVLSQTKISCLKNYISFYKSQINKFSIINKIS